MDALDKTPEWFRAADLVNVIALRGIVIEYKHPAISRYENALITVTPVLKDGERTPTGFWAELGEARMWGRDLDEACALVVAADYGRRNFK